LEAREYYGLSKKEADEVVRQVGGAVGSWRDEAARLGIPKSERDFMARAFGE
jgi:hypothetical protein